MSDNYIFLQDRTETRDVPYEKTVIEKRAPTDDSIRIYSEMVEKAQKSVVDAFRIESNILNVSVVVFKECDVFYDQRTVRYKCKLNGVNFDGSVKIEAGNDREEIIRAVVEKLSINITQIILDNINGNDIASLLGLDKYAR